METIKTVCPRDCPDTCFIDVFVNKGKIFKIKVMQALATLLKRSENWLFEDPWQALAIAMQNTFSNGRLEDILEGKTLELATQPLNRYQTLSGKIEFSASSVPDPGVRRLPFQEALESCENTFVLLNSATPFYTHSQVTDVYGPIPEVVWINIEDAGSMGIDDGNVVNLYNDFGSVTLKAKITDNVLPGTLWAPRPLTGLNNQPLNALAPDEVQKIGGGPVFNSIRVKIRIT